MSNVNIQKRAEDEVEKTKGEEVEETEETEDESTLSDAANDFITAFSEKTAKAICDALGYSLDEITEFDSDGSKYELRFGKNVEFIGFESYDDAKQEAIDYLVDMWESDSGTLPGENFVRHYVFMSDTDRRLLAQEEADSYVGELDDDRTIEEADMQDEYDAAESDEDKDQVIENAREKIRSDMSGRIEGELDDPIQYFVEDHGMYTVEELLKASFISIDTERLAQDAVQADGIGHFLAMYDGEEIEVEDSYWYRTN